MPSSQARVLITGGAGALGLATARELSRRGATVAGIDIVPSGSFPGPFAEVDVSDAASVEERVPKLVAQLGGLDVLVNNAGMLALQDPGAAITAREDTSVQVNYLGAWCVTASALPALLESRGRVVNVSSLLALVNAPFVPGYAASKRALTAYSDVLRMQYRGQLSVTTVYPGFLDTPIHDGALRQGLSVRRLVTFTIAGRRVLTLEERVERAARALARACVRRRARRNQGLTLRGGLTRWSATHVPQAVDAFMNWRVGYCVKRGMTVRLDPGS